MYQGQTLEQKQIDPRLKDKVAIVTGGARGLGECISRALADAGANVIIADFRCDLAEETAQKIRKGGGNVSCQALDLRSEEDVRRAVEDIAQRMGRLDILVNNAGVDVTVSVEELSVEDWDRVIATNLRGPFLTSKFAFPIMKNQGGGQIVNVVSTAAKRTWANASAYHSSKWGLLGLSHSLHVEGRPNRIKVTAVIAGGMRTPFLLDRFPDLDPGILQDPMNVANAVRFALTQPDETVIPEIMVLPMKETSWP